MKRILFTISGLHFEKDEGAKNRLNSFINSYNEEGYQVDVLLFFSLKSLGYLLTRKKYLDSRTHWYLFPSLPISRNLFLARIALFFEQIIFAVFSRIHKYAIIQSEIRGDVAKYKPKDSFLIVDFHGDSVTEAKFRNNNKSYWFTKFLIEVQKNSIKYADHIVGVSENLINQLEKVSSNNFKSFTIISCSVDIGRFKEVTSAAIVDGDEKIILGYLGGLQEWQNVDVILTIVIALYAKNKNIFFALYTNNEINPGIQAKLDLLGKENYVVRNLRFKEVPKFLKALDAGFLIRENLPLNIVSSPTKTAEYLAAGVPVICTKFSGDYRRSIKHKKEGFVLQDVLPGEEELIELGEYLQKVKNNRKYYKEVAFAAAQKRTWSNEFLVLKEKLQNSFLNG